LKKGRQYSTWAKEKEQKDKQDLQSTAYKIKD
jgi:hypothetical protein